MSLFIEKVHLCKVEPLTQDFSIDAKLLNLIYGPNEAGKTLITEFMLKCLFSTGKRSNWLIRDRWKPGRGSRIELTLPGGEKVSLTISSRKRLEDLLGVSEPSLPPNLSRLMVVKSGETALSDMAPGGLDRDILKKILSHEGLLDNLRNKLSKTLGKARFVNGEIVADDRGPNRDIREKSELIKKLENLLASIREQLSGAPLAGKKLELKAVEDSVADLERARDHRAYRLNVEIEDLESRKKALPERSDLQQSISDLRLCTARKEDLNQKSATVERLEEETSDLPWFRNVLEALDRFGTTAPETGASTFFTVAMYSAFALVVVSALAGWTVPGVISLLAGVAFVVARVNSLKKLLTNSEKVRVISRLSTEFERRSGQELTDRATLKTMIETLQKGADLREHLRGEITALETEIAALLEKVDSVLQVLPREEMRENRNETLKGIISELDELGESVELKRQEMNALGTSILLETPSAVDWDQDRHRSLLSRHEELQRELEKLEDASSGLKKTIANELNETSMSSIEEHTEALMKRIETVSGEHTRMKARALAEMQVHAVLDDLALHEDETIRRGLRSDAVTGTLSKVTGYSGLDLDEIRRVIVRTRDGSEPFFLDELSTGAREQILLALRSGFLQDLLREPAFLILDDAFQHSDWARRKVMVDLTFDLIAAGWQIFYFTMDDHIKDLFIAAAGRNLKEKDFLFRSLEPR
jgi:uncharacterized protein YhaN